MDDKAVGTGGSQLSPQDSPHEDSTDARTLDPTGAATVELVPSFKTQQQEARKWPDGFWGHFNAGTAHYNRGHYQRAKEAFTAARFLLDDYSALDAALLRTYRKLYKAAIAKKMWADAYGELCGLFKSLPGDVTDADRRQFNAVVDALRSTDASFPADPLPIQKRARTKRQEPKAVWEPAPTTEMSVQRDDAWQPSEGEKPFRPQERQLTSIGFVAVRRTYIEEAGGYGSCHVRTHSRDGEIVSDRDWAQGFYRLKLCPTGERLIGYSDDLRMSLWTLNGDRLAERDIGREAHDNKYHVRCVDLSEDGGYCLFTSTTRAYLLDQRLRTLCVWITPPPDGYTVDCKSQSPESEQVKKDLAALELSGHPTQDEIKAQFRRLVLRYHPDRNPGDVAAQERTKEIITAYRAVSEEDVLAALDGSGAMEHYHRILDEIDLGSSMKVTVSIGGPGDWIYASHVAPRAERIYLGCYSGRIYCVDRSGAVLTTYSTDAPIVGILERRGYLYVWTSTSLQVLEHGRVTNHIDLREGGLDCFTEWGFIVTKGVSLVLYANDGAWLGSVSLPKAPGEVIPTTTGLVAYTAKERYRVALSRPSKAAGS